jgi:sulfur carrier protein ThiS
MEVRVSLFGNLGRYMPEGSTGFSFAASLEDGETVQNMLDKLKLPSELPLIVIVNGGRADAGRVLKDHDDISLFLVSGGG